MKDFEDQKLCLETQEKATTGKWVGMRFLTCIPKNIYLKCFVIILDILYKFPTELFAYPISHCDS